MRLQSSMASYASVLLALWIANAGAQTASGAQQLPTTCPDLPGPTSTPYQISSQSDADKIAGCNEIPGNILISSPELTKLDLNGIQVIHGNLSIRESPVLRELAADALQRIDKTFSMEDLPKFERLEMRNLSEVTSALRWNDLPLFDTVEVRPNGTLLVSLEGEPGLGLDERKLNGTLSITQTALKDLDFLDISFSAYSGIVEIRNNPSLIELPPSFDSIAVGPALIDIRNNHEDLVASFSNLSNAIEVVISNALDVKLPKLAQLSGNLTLLENNFERLRLPWLLSILGSLILRDNENLFAVDCPELTSIGRSDGTGDFVVENNTKLQTLDGFPKFGYTSGSLNISGILNEVWLPSLSSIKGGFYLNTTSSTRFDCSAFDTLHLSTQEKNPQSPYTCTNWDTTLQTDQAKHNAPAPRSAKTQAIQGLAIVAGLAVVFSSAYLIYRARKEKEKKRVAALEAVELADRTGGVYREEEGRSEVVDGNGDGDGLPRYSRLPKPGESPPGYVAVVQVPTNGEETRPVKGARWAFWRR